MWAGLVSRCRTGSLTYRLEAGISSLHIAW